MDRREHGDSSSVPSAPASGERTEATDHAEPFAAAAAPEAEPSPALADSPRAVHEAAIESEVARSSDPDPAGTLSPAVRRLVRQYDLDITGVYGSGPAGKIRVGDIIGMLDASSRAAIGAAGAGARQTKPTTAHDAGVARSEARRHPANDSAVDTPSAPPTTTVFECDVSRVLSHRKRERRGDLEPLLASYFIAACLEAIRSVPEIAARIPDSTQGPGTELAPRLGVSLTATDGSVRRALVGLPATSLEERMRNLDAQLRASIDDDLRSADILIHYYAATGSLLATPTPIGQGHVGSIGIGRVRREIVVKAVDGQEAPRVAALCYLTLTFLPERIALERANRFVSEWVRVLEQWPIEPSISA